MKVNDQCATVVGGGFPYRCGNVRVVGCEGGAAAAFQRPNHVERADCHEWSRPRSGGCPDLIVKRRAGALPRGRSLGWTAVNPRNRRDRTVRIACSVGAYEQEVGVEGGEHEDRYARIRQRAGQASEHADQCEIERPAHRQGDEPALRVNVARNEGFQGDDRKLVRGADVSQEVRRRPTGARLA